MYDELVKRLRRYSENVVAYKLDADFASAIQEAADAIEELSKRPEIPETGIGDLSDGYHTFNGLYYQRMVLFSALVNAYQDRAWKSWKHEDGKLCFNGGWFIVGIDTPQGSYTYHYEAKDFDLFDCEELPVAKHWDGHTEKDVTRLLSLDMPRWIPVSEKLPEKSGVYLGWMQWDLTDPDDNPSAYPIEYDAEEEAFGWWKSYLDPESFGYAGEEFIRYEGVTHWQRLPEPPKEET